MKRLVTFSVMVLIGATLFATDVASKKQVIPKQEMKPEACTPSCGCIAKENPDKEIQERKSEREALFSNSQTAFARMTEL